MAAAVLAQSSKPKIPSHIESLANQARSLPPELGADVLGCVESCRSVGLHRNKRTKRLDLVFQERRCMHVVDREFGLPERALAHMVTPCHSSLTERTGMAGAVQSRG